MQVCSADMLSSEACLVGWTSSPNDANLIFTVCANNESSDKAIIKQVESDQYEAEVEREPNIDLKQVKMANTKRKLQKFHIFTAIVFLDCSIIRTFSGSP